MRRLRRLLVVLVLLVAVLAGAAWLLLRGSLARLDGKQHVVGPAQTIRIERDVLGTATIEARNRRDIAWGLGWTHAQERYFQMDLLRRSAAGELAELVSAAALPIDRQHRLHRFRARAAQTLAALPPAQRELLAAYRDGVNAGLGALAVRPWEYLLLRATPVAWREEDTLLTIDAMFLDLNGDGRNQRELDLARWRAVLPPAMLAFLVQPGSNWDAALDGSGLPAIPIPGAEVFDLRTLDPHLLEARPSTAALLPVDAGLLPGSNNFAVGGALTADGAALVADDMHLSLGVPNLWFRVRLRYPAASGADRIELNGVGLPGTPALIAGSNGHIAWGFTNSYGDWLDWVRIERDPQRPERYRVPEGWATFEHHREVLHVHGGADENLDIEETRWGPVAATDVDGVPLALAWTAHQPRVLNLGLLDLEHCTEAACALDLGPHIGMPAQNLVVGDAAGHIGWTLTGNAIPRRQGFDPLFPADFSKPGVGWNGWLEPEEFPRIVDPPAHRLWTANARTLGGDALGVMGDGGYDLGARAQQIRDDLLQRETFAPADLLAVQLDDRAVLLARWQALLAATLAGTDDPALAEFKRQTAGWHGHAAVDAVDYRLVRAFRQRAIDAVLAPFAALARHRFKDFTLPSAQGYEAAVWALLEARPAHLLDPQFADWDALLHAAARRVVDDLAKEPGGLAARTWGERNTVAIRHPLSRALPGLLTRALDMPVEPLPGDSNMPRVQGVAFGASERFAIAPGHEDRAYLMMPGGQSGHPLSPFHGTGHADWVAGRPTPLLPGPAEHRLDLVPAH